jgi:hypothetical protein
MKTKSTKEDFCFFLIFFHASLRVIASPTHLQALARLFSPPHLPRWTSSLLRPQFLR